MKKILRVAEGFFINTILITFLVCPGLFAAEEILPTPEDIIVKNNEAMGGKEALKKIKNKKTVTTKIFPQRNKKIKATDYKEPPNNYYQSSSGGTSIGTNGKIAWIINPKTGVRLLEGLEASIYLSAGRIYRPDVPYKSMKTEGIEQINGKDCYKVVKTPEKGNEKIFYYDTKSFLIVKTIDFFKLPQRGNNKFEVYFEGYQKINGILFPYKEVHFSNGQKIEERTYEKIELNIEMPEGIFDIPEDLKAIMNKNETEQHAQQ